MSTIVEFDRVIHRRWLALNKYKWGVKLHQGTWIKIQLLQ